MLEKEQQQLELEEKHKIHAETARVQWKEVELFYAKGTMIFVADDLDLIKVAHSLSIDDTSQVERWIEENKLLRSFDEQAKFWADSKEDLWSVVVKPWVLVQSIKKTVN